MIESLGNFNNFRMKVSKINYLNSNLIERNIFHIFVQKLLRSLLIENWDGNVWETLKNVGLYVNPYQKNVFEIEITGCYIKNVITYICMFFFFCFALYYF